jgi:predicted P-loop ATPase
MADFEEQIANRFKDDDERWSAATDAARRATDEANARIAAFAEAGIPAEYRPELHLINWSFRGGNASAGRRAELRRVAASPRDAQARTAKVEIDRVEAKLRADIASLSVVTSEAKDLLAQLPSAAQFMPRLSIEEEVRNLLKDGRS